jgi:hypothetical protein
MSEVTYVGDPLFLWVKLTDPIDHRVIDDAEVTFDMFPPPRDPKNKPSDRAYAYRSGLTAVYDRVNEVYYAVVDTTDFPPGKWWWRSNSTRPGEGTKHEYALLRLHP